MKIGFFGTPDISSYCLEELCRDFEISFVVTTDDKRCGRNQKLSICAAKNFALCHDIPVLQPGNLKDPVFLDELKNFNADIFVVVAYGKIIPREVFDIPRLKTINLHPSLLPKLRGAAPIRWALINGDIATGVTVQMINEKMDAGDIILQERIELDENINSAELYDIVMPVGARLLVKAINLLSSGEAELIKQNEEDATFCGKIERETAHIDWKNNSESIHNLVRGLNPKPVTWTTFRGMNVKIYKTMKISEDLGLSLEPGFLAKYQKKRLVAGTGNGILEIVELQPENKKVIDAPSFLNGYRIQEGDRFE